MDFLRIPWNYLCKNKSLIFGDCDSTSVHYVLVPAIKITRFWGLCPIEINIRTKKISVGLYDLAYSMIILSIMSVGFILGVLELLPNGDKSKLVFGIIASFTAWGQIFSLFMVAAMAILTVWPQRRRLILIYTTIEKIDDKLRDIGVQNDYKAYRRSLMYKILAAMIIPLKLSMVNCIIINPETYMRPYLFNFCYFFICFIPILIIMLKELQYINILTLIQMKYTQLNDYLKVINKELSRDAMIDFETELPNQKHKHTVDLHKTNIRQNSDSKLIAYISEMPSSVPIMKKNQVDLNLIVEILDTLKHIHSILTKLVEEVQRFFGSHLLFLFSTCFGIITIQIYHLFAVYIKQVELSFMVTTLIIFWLLVQTAAILINIAVCNRTSLIIAETGPILHKMKNASSHRNLFQSIQLFSLQILHRHTEFTAAGFFTLDYKLLTSIVAAVTTYLVIIIQFHIASEKNSMNCSVN